MSGVKDLLGDEPYSYPLVPGFKTEGTSQDAARAASATAPVLRERVFAAIKAAGHHGLTPDEAAEDVGESVLAVRPRVTESCLSGFHP